MAGAKGDELGPGQSRVVEVFFEKKLEVVGWERTPVSHLLKPGWAAAGHLPIGERDASFSIIAWLKFPLAISKRFLVIPQKRHG